MRGPEDAWTVVISPIARLLFARAQHLRARAFLVLCWRRLALQLAVPELQLAHAAASDGGEDLLLKSEPSMTSNASEGEGV